MPSDLPGTSQTQDVVFDVDTEGKECKVFRLSTKDNLFVKKNASLLMYTIDGAKKSFKSKVEGVFRFQEGLVTGRPLKSGDVIGSIGGECSHEMIYLKQCVLCHAMVDDKPHQAGYVSMVHDRPKLMVNQKKATEIAEGSRTELLQDHKLVLMVDLDQTIIHTTDRDPGMDANAPDVVSFVMRNVKFHTKLRPNAKEFLDRMHDKYEMHVCTFGRRDYALEILNMLGLRSYFKGRVLTRDELLSNTDKSANLKSLFPSGAEMVLMLDDRRDVWGYADALIWVKQYIYFHDVGDINDPKVIKGRSIQIQEPGKDVEENGQADSDCNPNILTKEPSECIHSDDDTVLLSLAEVLEEIHRRFFKIYDSTGVVPEAKNIARELRSEVFKGEVIVFSGLPKYKDRKHDLIIQCEDYGAVVHDSVTSETTVLVTLVSHTKKFMEAHHRKLPIVNRFWVEASVANWRNLDKKMFMDKIWKTPDVQSDKVDFTPGRVELQNMNDEVDEALNGSTDDEIDDVDGVEDVEADHVADDGTTEEEPTTSLKRPRFDQTVHEFEAKHKRADEVSEKEPAEGTLDDENGDEEDRQSEISSDSEMANDIERMLNP